MINKRLSEAREKKVLLDRLKSLMSKFTEDLKDIGADELILTKTQNHNSFSYQITLPNCLVQNFEEIKSYLDADEKYNELFHYLIYGHPEEANDGIEWSLRTEDDYNRIHINGSGLPYSLRNIGLGKKIYKRIIKDRGYISTKHDNAYKYSDLLWESLIRDEELYCFISHDVIIAILKDVIPQDLFAVLKKSFGTFDKGNCLFNEEFCSIYKTELAEHQLTNFCK